MFGFRAMMHRVNRIDTTLHQRLWERRLVEIDRTKLSFLGKSVSPSRQGPCIYSPNGLRYAKERSKRFSRFVSTIRGSRSSQTKETLSVSITINILTKQVVYKHHHLPQSENMATLSYSRKRVSLAAVSCPLHHPWIPTSISGASFNVQYDVVRIVNNAKLSSLQLLLGAYSVGRQ